MRNAPSRTSGARLNNKTDLLNLLINVINANAITSLIVP